MLDPKRYRKGRVSRVGNFRDIVRLLNSFRIITEPGSGLSYETTPAGTSVWRDEPREFPIRITARDGANYAWNAVKGTTGGGWTDMTKPAGTLVPLKDAAIETNGVVAAVPQVVLARREEFGHRITFHSDTCS